MTKLFITGDSHTGTLRRAYEQIKDTLPRDLEITIRPLGIGSGKLGVNFFKDYGTYIEINGFKDSDKTVRQPNKDMRDATVVIILPFNSLRVCERVAWRHTVPEALAQTETVMSTEALEAICLKDARPSLSYLAALKRLGVNVVAVECPLLFKNNKLFEMTRQDVALYIDQYYRALVCQQLEAIDISFVRVPDMCIDENGLMKPEYRSEDSDDGMRGNTDFGALLLKAVLAKVAPNSAAPEVLSEKTKPLPPLRKRGAKRSKKR